MMARQHLPTASAVAASIRSTHTRTPSDGCGPGDPAPDRAVGHVEHARHGRLVDAEVLGDDSQLGGGHQLVREDGPSPTGGLSLVVWVIPMFLCELGGGLDGRDTRSA